jgi:hypothetical protein
VRRLSPCSRLQAFADARAIRYRAAKLRPKNPISSIAQVEGSGALFAPARGHSYCPGHCRLAYRAG